MPEPAPSCNLMSKAGGSLQLLLGLVAFSALAVKRYWEFPRRPWKVWMFDSSKQGTAAVVVHIANLMLSRYMMNQQDGDSRDECTWYFTNLLLDSTVGLVLIYYLLRLSSWAIEHFRLHRFRSGDYGNPPRYKWWMCQLLLYNCLMLVEKLVVFLLLLLPFLQKIGSSVLVPIGNLSPNLELALALFITPLIINVVWFWCVDNFLMSVETKHLQKVTYRKSSQGGRSRSSNSVSSPGLEERLVDSSDDEGHVVVVETARRSRLTSLHL